MDPNVIYSSFIAGSIQTILGHPFDTVKTRIQLYNTSYKNTIYHLFKQEGKWNFYKIKAIIWKLELQKKMKHVLHSYLVM